MASPLEAALFFLVLGTTLASCKELTSRRSPVIRQPRSVPTTGCYIVAMQDDTSEDELQQVAAKAVEASEDAKLHGLVHRVKKAFTVKLNPHALEMVQRLPGVEYIEEEGFAVGDQDDETLPWHVDRIDQKYLPLDHIYSPIGDGQGVDVYIFDTGINYDHEEFEGRAQYGGYDPVDEYYITVENDTNHQRRYGRDCHGHGTHVASICGGKTYGSAKKVNIYSIRVLECHGRATWSTVIDGFDYVSRIVPVRGRPAIISMSLIGSYQRTVNEAVERLASEGITVVSGAGNGRTDSCRRSPAGSNGTITVAGSNSTDGLYRLTNYGSCVDIFAPASRIQGASLNCLECYRYRSGTSLATPLVSGVAAIHLSGKPWLTPADVKATLINDSVRDVLVYDESIIPRSSWAITKNRLLRIQTSCGGSQFFLNSGTITSPGYPNNYPADLCCIWNITAEENQYVQFDLYVLHLEDKNDALKAYDGSCPSEEDNADTDLVKEFTGDRGLERYTYHTESNILCLKLVTDGTTSFKGFNATYKKVTKCGRNFTTSMGTFQTPNWPQTYPSNFNCEWFIQLPDAKKVVEIICVDEPYGFAGTYPDCPEDFIIFYDRHSSQNTSYGPYCEFTKPGTIKMSSNLARVHFYAGPSYNSSHVGVKCSFQSADAPPPPPPCGELLNTSSGTFQTPNWPETYPVNIDCVWRIQLPDSNMLVRVGCSEDPFGIAGFLPACEKDYLKFYNGHSKQDIEFGPFCHYEKPKTTVMNSNKAMAIFHAGPVHNAARKGFKCSFESIPQCGGSLTAANGSFQTPNWPETYPVNIDCVWKIQLPDSNMLVRVGCSEDPFGIAGFLPACEKDYLKFYNGHSKQDIEFGPFCHYEKPMTTVMTSNKAMAIFHAGPVHNAARKGFKCSFESIPQCGGSLTAANGSFQTPNWPETYPVNINCTWTIILPDSSKLVEMNFETPFGIAGSLPTCSKDKLHVYDDNAGTQHGPYCYFTVPNPPIMTSNRARVVLLAGPVHSPSRVGFRATYRSVT